MSRCGSRLPTRSESGTENEVACLQTGRLSGRIATPAESFFILISILGSIRQPSACSVQTSCPTQNSDRDFGVSGMPLLETGATYQHPCKLGQDLEVRTWVEEWARRTFLVNHDIVHSDGRTALTGFAPPRADYASTGFGERHEGFGDTRRDQEPVRRLTANLPRCGAPQR